MATKSNYNGKTRYAFGGGVVDNGQMLGWWERTIFPSSVSDIPFPITSKYVNRPDLVAYDMYGASTLMWLVLQYNNILDPSLELVEGTILTLPTKTRVLTEIMKSRSPTLSAI